jgi:hypothetical protein
LQKYLSEDDIVEFLNTGSISKFDNIEFTKEEIFREYFYFIKNLSDEELSIFLTLIKDNQDNLMYFSQSFIKIVLDHDCINENKIKLIEQYTNINNKNKLFYFGLKLMLKDKFRDFYTFSPKCLSDDMYKETETRHIKYYLLIFKNIKVKKMDYYFPELNDQSFRIAHEEIDPNYPYLEYADKYFDKLLKLL